MRRFNRYLLVAALAAAAPTWCAAQGQSDTQALLDQTIDRISQREQEEVKTIRMYSPLIETYIQDLRPDKDLGLVPIKDHYFLGVADLAKGAVEKSLLDKKKGLAGKLNPLGALSNAFSASYVPEGFLEMIYIDPEGFSRRNYHFDYIHREFLGELRCLVFDVSPLPHSGKGRFKGRVWVEDQGYAIVRFNGVYTPISSSFGLNLHFDSWRVNAGPSLWLPAFVYSEESNFQYALVKRLQFKAQTRLWGYNLGHAGQEQELSKVLIESPTAIKDQSESTNDVSPIQAQRIWERQAEDNVIDRLERLGLLAPRGEVDKMLEVVVNNLEVTNNLDIQPEVRCRILLTSTLESFTIGHTIVISRGLIDVLPDEASLATMVAHELGHVVLGHRIDPQFAFFDRLLFDDKDTFRHFVFARPAGEEDAATAKSADLLKNSPYKDQLGNAALFVQALNARATEIPNLVSPHLGSRVPAATATQLPASAAPSDPAKRTGQITALPLGGRIKVDPWSDRIEMIKAKPVGAVTEREKMPFEVTPFMPYLTRQSSGLTPAPSITADSKAHPVKKPNE
jgi:hypothetical protein